MYAQMGSPPSLDRTVLTLAPPWREAIALNLVSYQYYQFSGSTGQPHAMVIREVCPECKSARHKSNGHIHKPTAPRVWSHWRAVVRLACSTSPACSTAARRAVAAAQMRLIASDTTRQRWAPGV